MNKLIKVSVSTIIILLYIFSSNTICNSQKIETNDDSKIVYLTFDDGPTYLITDEILDVLKQNNIKATFFIVGKEINGKERILKRIYNEGHGIGVHTYTHNFKLIYKSEDIFVKENILAAEKIEEVTGFYPNFVRFPGGSSKRLTESLLEKLHKNNFKVFDWNASSEDGVNFKLNEKALYKNSFKIRGDRNNVIILMHCNYYNNNTVKALPKIINEYKSEGYIFEPISDFTKEYYYRIKKK